MSLDTMFLLANALALAGWLALAFAPLRRVALIVFARIVGASLCIFYVSMFALTKTGAPDLALDYSLSGIAGFFSVPGYLLVGWIHYLAFDLWVGSWEAEEAARAGMPHALLLPCLALTFLLGPVGLLAFLAARAFAASRKSSFVPPT